MHETHTHTHTQNHWVYLTLNVRVGLLDYARLSHGGPRLIGGMSSVRVFLRDPSPYS